MKITIKELVALQNKIHQQNVEMGWWDNHRSFATFACLFHSELSEAMEGDRRGLMDDHLPEYEMFWVELADFAIRCIDWLGSRNYVNYIFYASSPSGDRVAFLAEMHKTISEAYFLSWYASTYNGDETSGHASVLIASAVSACFAFASLHDFDLLDVINKKVEYNKQRLDHKRENREKDGGKKY